MGNTQAADYANGVREGWASLRQAVTANLQSNHFPPLPLAYVGPVIEAIGKAIEGDSQADVDITSVKESGMVPRQAREDDGRLYIRVADLLEITHSWGFCDDDEDV